MPTITDNTLERVEGSKHTVSLVVLMVCIYIFLYIERPWESISYLRGIPIERVYAAVMIVVALLSHKFIVVRSPVNKWVYGLLSLHFLLAPFAYSASFAVDQGIEYAKIVVLYLLMLAVADDEATLKLLLKAYLLAMITYSVHSLWEYHNGRHVFRMEISRMIGVGESLNDPNAFGASVVLSLPIAYLMLRYEGNRWHRRLYYGYFPLVVLCVVLTGSRSSFVAMMFVMVVWVLVQKGKRKFVLLLIIAVSMVALWSVMPEEKQIRIRTIWDREVGPKNARESADGRKYGWQASLEMFRREPLTGVGAGGDNFIGYRIENRIDAQFGRDASALQAHVMYGEVLAEFGITGAICMVGLVVSTGLCCLRARKMVAADSFLSAVGGAIVVCLLLLLIFGFAGHNFYRPLWLWLAAWSGSLYMIACKTRQQRALELK